MGEVGSWGSPRRLALHVAGLPVKGHTWQDEKNWGYRSYTSSEALTDAYLALLAKLHPLIDGKLR